MAAGDLRNNYLAARGNGRSVSAVVAGRHGRPIDARGQSRQVASRPYDLVL